MNDFRDTCTRNQKVTNNFSLVKILFFFSRYILIFTYVHMFPYMKLYKSKIIHFCVYFLTGQKVIFLT